MPAETATVLVPGLLGRAGHPEGDLQGLAGLRERCRLVLKNELRGLACRTEHFIFPARESKVALSTSHGSISCRL